MEPNANRRKKRPSTASHKAGSEDETTIERRRSGGGRPPREDLSAQQLRAINALITQPTMAAAAKQIGVHPRTICRWQLEPAFRKEYLDQMAELQVELWRQMLAARQDAWRRLLELLPSSDQRIALRASTWLLERLLSVPPMLARLEADEGPNPEIPPRLRSFLEEAGSAETRDGGDAA